MAILLLLLTRSIQICGTKAIHVKGKHRSRRQYYFFGARSFHIQSFSRLSPNCEPNLETTTPANNLQRCANIMEHRSPHPLKKEPLRTEVAYKKGDNM